MALNIIKGSVKDAKEHLMRQALKRFPLDMMLPCGYQKNLESCFIYEPELGIVTFSYNVKGKDRSTKTEAVKLDRRFGERRSFDYDLCVPELRSGQDQRK